jgi:cell division protein FtsQ
MHQSIDKKNKVLLYLILLLILSTINNKKIDNQNKNLTKVTIINVSGLSEDKNLQIINKINKLINKNIFFINKKKINNIISGYNLVEQYSAKKVYPSTINIKIKPAKLIAVKNDDPKIFIGSNGKLIFDENMKKELPILFGEFNSKKFLEFRNVIKNSDFQFSDFKSIVFYVSKRWDIKTNNNILIKLPEKDIPEALKNAFMILKNNKLEINRVIDLRIPNRIIKQ